MPIIVSRETGAILNDPGYTQEQKEQAWEIIGKQWIKNNKHILHEMMEREAKANS